MASVAKRKRQHNGVESETWVVRYTDQSGKRRLKTFDKKKDADAFRSQVDIDVRDGTHVAPSQSVTLGRAMDAYLEDCKARWKRGELAGNTLYGYETKAKGISENLRRRRLTELTGLMVEDFANEMRVRYSKRTVQMFVSVVSLSIGYAIRRRWLKVNPLIHDRVRMVVGEREAVSIPSKAQIGQLINSIATQEKRPYLTGPRGESPIIRAAIVALGIFGGLRRGEMAGLQWEDVDFIEGVLRLRHSYSRIDKLKAPKTKAGKRSVPMSSPIRAVLQQIWEGHGRPTAGYVLTGRRGLPFCPNKLTSFHWPATMKHAGLLDEKGTPLFSMHEMRHAYVSLLAEQNLPPLVISRLVGHSKIAVTMDVYAHLFPEDNSGAQAVERAVAQLGGATMLPPIAAMDATTARP
ncbi:tyrosine-type recombinase/integrase [Ancylobacter pratisalsi]|uniref:Site-specific integrase n=1 Tax=Ancylobacter pratisalsi TaxID=1745854 RepID=A0A6P1YUI2_9HYPH|nr:site-specific integrase [Ancylobacter pratisalsi]QIB36540.1 site-specific integrase [Ancylobacter pratisalsi]